MEYKKLNKSVCEEMFREQIQIEEPGDVGKSETKLQKEGMKKTFKKILKHITGVETTVKGMETFRRTKRIFSCQLRTALVR